MSPGPLSSRHEHEAVSDHFHHHHSRRTTMEDEIKTWVPMPPLWLLFASCFSVVIIQVTVNLFAYFSRKAREEAERKRLVESRQAMEASEAAEVLAALRRRRSEYVASSGTGSSLQTPLLINSSSQPGADGTTSSSFAFQVASGPAADDSPVMSDHAVLVSQRHELITAVLSGNSSAASGSELEGIGGYKVRSSDLCLQFGVVKSFIMIMMCFYFLPQPGGWIRYTIFGLCNISSGQWNFIILYFMSALVFPPIDLAKPRAASDAKEYTTGDVLSDDDGDGGAVVEEGDYEADEQQVVVLNRSEEETLIVPSETTSLISASNRPTPYSSPVDFKRSPTFPKSTSRKKENAVVGTSKSAGGEKKSSSGSSGFFLIRWFEQVKSIDSWDLLTVLGSALDIEDVRTAFIQATGFILIYVGFLPIFFTHFLPGFILYCWIYIPVFFLLHKLRVLYYRRRILGSWLLVDAVESQDEKKIADEQNKNQSATGLSSIRTVVVKIGKFWKTLFIVLELLLVKAVVLFVLLLFLQLCVSQAALTYANADLGSRHAGTLHLSEGNETLTPASYLEVLKDSVSNLRHDPGLWRRPLHSSESNSSSLLSALPNWSLASIGEKGLQAHHHHHHQKSKNEKNPLEGKNQEVKTTLEEGKIHGKDEGLVPKADWDPLRDSNSEKIRIIAWVGFIGMLLP